MFDLTKESLKGLNPNEVPVLAAALAFYALLSLAPLITISIAIAGLVFNQAAVEGGIVTATAEFIGEPAAVYVQDIIRNSFSTTTGGLLAVVSFVFLLFAASTVFWQLRISLNMVWGLMPTSEQSSQNYRETIKDRQLSVVAALAVGFLLLGAMLFNALAATIFLRPIQNLLAGFEWIAWLLSLVVAPAMYLVIFAAIFKLLPNAKIKWRDVWPGAAVTAGLFWIGSYLIWLYLARSGVASIYGAAGSIIVFLLWIYASAWIFLFGAKFTQVYANKYGTPIVSIESEN